MKIPAFSEFGINYVGCANYTDDTEKGFGGTFSDGEINTIMRCDIAAGNGNIYRFAAHFEPPSLTEFIIFITNLQITLKEALDCFEAKLKRLGRFDRDSYQYKEFVIGSKT